MALTHPVHRAGLQPFPVSLYAYSVSRAALENVMLYFFRSSVMFVSDHADTTEHTHHLLEIFISTDGPLRLVSGPRTFIGNNIIIDADIPHRVSGVSGPIIVLGLENESATARRLKEKYLGEEGQRVLAGWIYSPIRSSLERLAAGKAGMREAAVTRDHIVAILLGQHSDSGKKIDSRINVVLSLLRTLPGKKTDLPLLARLVNLSESRLTHLFTEQVGVPMRRFLLWLRLLDALKIILTDRPFTEAAHEAGFSDSAHLSRTFKRMFGLTLREIFSGTSDNRFVQIMDEKNDSHCH